ncbi:hypothetical protein GCM10008917_11620 [Paraclostridium tenue]|uniref:Uncharacterized protein n=1 Tax=Paraclostridium tenue TaxID=1737 RepID=A0ABP3XHT8_9FIRM
MLDIFPKAIKNLKGYHQKKIDSNYFDNLTYVKKNHKMSIFFTISKIIMLKTSILFNELSIEFMERKRFIEYNVIKAEGNN